MRRSAEQAIQIKTPGQIEVMRAAGLVVARMLRDTAAAVAPGVSTAELDQIAERTLRDAGATSSFQGYYGYPATICASVNSEIVHGIPRPDVILAEGDVISIDAGAIVRGWHGDAAITVPVGPVAPEVTALMEACELALWRGLAAAVAGGRLTDISHAVESSARSSGPYGIVREYTGHGIGTEMHMEPSVLNYGRPGKGPVLAEGMTLAIEPMLVMGKRYTRVLDDDWTVVTADGSWAAHFEHTVAITADGPVILTAEDGGAGGFARLEAASSVTRSAARSPARSA